MNAGATACSSPFSGSTEAPAHITQAPILIVDDTQYNLVLLKSALKALGEPIVTAASGEEALAACRDNDFAVILLDVQMPGMDGFEAASESANPSVGERHRSSATALKSGKVRRGYCSVPSTISSTVVAEFCVLGSPPLGCSAKARWRRAARAQEEHKFPSRRPNCAARTRSSTVRLCRVARPQGTLRMVTSYVQLARRHRASSTRMPTSSSASHRGCGECAR
jgi:hypothetical protein